MENVLESIRRHYLRLDPGRIYCVVFDIDNTLFDTRARTLHIAHKFDTMQHSQYFKNLTEFAKINNLNELSMGMSNDYECAIKNGATFIRIGSKIFADD